VRESAWTIACGFLIVIVANEPTIGTIFFTLPFWASWLVVGIYLIWCFFGSETLLLRPDRVLFLRKAVVRLPVRDVPMSQSRRIRSCLSKHPENHQYLRCIEVQTTGKLIRFGFRIPSREKAWLIHQLNCFAACQVDANDSQSVFEFVSNASSPVAAPAILMTLHESRSEPAADTSWEQLDHADGVEFIQCGHLCVLELMDLLCINAFWNGIVTIHVLSLFGFRFADNDPPQGTEWWQTFVLLIPFVVLGLVMLAKLVAVLMEWFRRTSWRFVHDEMTTQIRWPCFSRTQRCDLNTVHHLELRPYAGNQSGMVILKTALRMIANSNFQLVFVSKTNVDQCSIPGLTKHEAR